MGQNVLWTFAIAAAMLWALETYAVSRGAGERGTLHAAAVIAAAVLASVFCDGGVGGILLIACMYLFKGDKKRWWLGYVLSLCVLTVLGMTVQVFAILALFLLQEYNGQKGREYKALFYVFYPAHLLALWGVAALIA